MKSFVVTTAALIWANLPCQASPIWSCKTGPKPDAASPCADPEIVRLDKAIEQIGLTYEFKNPKPKAADAFDSSFLPPEADRKAN